MLRVLHRHFGASKKSFKYVVVLTANKTFSIHNLSLSNVLSQPAKKHSELYDFVRFASSSKDPEDTLSTDMDSDTEEIELFELDTQTPVKNLLYPDSEDLFICELKKCASTDNVLQLCSKKGEPLTKDQSVQAILTLWDHLKEDKDQTFKFQILKSQSEFQALLECLSQFATDMNVDEISCMLLYLTKLAVNLKHTTMQQLTEAFLRKASSDEPEAVLLPAISKFCVALNSIQGLYPKLVCIKIIPNIAQQTNSCDNNESLRLLTICFSHLYQIMSQDMLNLYRQKVKEMIGNGQITSENVKCILKILNFLNYPKWSHQNTELIRDLSLLLTDKVEKMQSKELVQLNKVFQSQLEPAAILSRIAKQSLKLLEKLPSTELLTCSVLNALPEKRAKMRETSEVFLQVKNVNSSVDLASLFKVLRLLKISDVKLCNQYWTNVVDEIRHKKEQLTVYQYGKYCHRYMHFNNNLGGTYRHNEFEKVLSKIVIKELETGLAAHVPSLFAKLSSFIIAYGHHPNTNRLHKDFLPDFIIDGFEEMVDQLSVIDCLYISRGLQIALGLRYKNLVPQSFGSQMVKIENVLNTATQRHLKDNLSLKDLNCIVRSYNNRKSSRKTALYQKIIENYHTTTCTLNSRLIREITFNLNVCGHRIDSICEKIIDYISENEEYVIGDTVEKILYSCYILGFQPDDSKTEAFKKSAEIIIRDFPFMTGLSIIQSCLALSFYNSLPEALIHKVFNVDFIKRLEEEIKMCYSKATYPEHISNKVMQLNRAVCLDFPESGVPWFQQNYIESQLSRMPTIRNRFNSDVKTFLLSLVPDTSLLRIDHITPYGYKIDFVLHLDRFQNFIPPPMNGNSLMENVTKLAILPLRFETFCENNIYYLKGQEHVKQRHLEILGYKVIHINYSEWNSMYMNVPGAKVNYLKNLLQIT